MQTQRDTTTLALTLDQLDDDCLECIFQHVHTLFAQLQIARVCRRFNAVIVRHWQRQSLYQTLNLTLWREWLPRFEDLRYFLHAVRDYLRVVEVRDESLLVFLTNLQTLLVEAFCLPNVQHFDLEDMLTDSCATDVEMRKLSELLPNLKVLRLSAPLSGRYIAEFQHLEELLLYVPQEKPYELDDTEFALICAKLHNLRVLDVRNYERSTLCMTPVLQCAQLRTLKLNLNALKPVLGAVLGAVLAMRNLKQLSVLLDYVVDVSRIQNIDTHDYKIYETVEFYEILHTQCARLTGIAVDLYYLPLHADWATDLALFDGGRKLRKFAICNCDFSAAALLQYAETMTSLEMLCCRTWATLTSTHVLHFVQQCPRLLHLDVSYCKNVDKQLLYETLKIFEQQQRKKPLHIYYLHSGLEAEIEQNSKFWRSQKYIKLSNGFPPDSETGLSYVQRGYEFDFE